ncbi:MAG: hypothetical protein ACQESR_15305 [Planctomycetota bacterium]
MKGPYERLKYTMQRVWECPACHHHERSDGSVTSNFCRCQRDIAPSRQRCMKLIKDGIRLVR